MLLRSFSALTFDAGLKFTGVNLELITSHDMYMFVEDSIRGGVSTISQRHAVANNPMVPESYNPDKPNEWLHGGLRKQLHPGAQDVRRNKQGGVVGEVRRSARNAPDNGDTYSHHLPHSYQQHGHPHHLRLTLASSPPFPYWN